MTSPTPLDPASERGREVADRLNDVLAGVLRRLGDERVQTSPAEKRTA